MQPNFSSVILNYGFRILWFNQILMQLAINTLNFALIIWVYKLTNSNFAVSVLILSIYIPAFLFGIFAGVFVDILDKKKVIILVDVLLAFFIGLFIFIHNSYSLILLNTFIINSLTQFFVPAEGSSIPLLVKRVQLFLANSLFSFTLYGSFMLGYSLTGPILNFWGINAIFYIGFFLLMFAFIISQKLPSLKVRNLSQEAQNILSLQRFDGILSLIISETKKTLKVLRGKLNVMTSIVLLAFLQGVIGILAVMTPSYTERILGIQAEDASLVLMLPLGLGMVFGAIFIGRSFHNIPRRLVVIPAIIISGILLFLVGLIPNFTKQSFVYAMGAFLMGVSAVAIIIPSQTILQENTAKTIRGKIFAVLFTLMNAFASFPVLIAGGLADILGETKVFMGLGAIIFAVGIFALRPEVFFAKEYLPFKVREFLGLGHWKR